MFIQLLNLLERYYVYLHLCLHNTVYYYKHNMFTVIHSNHTRKIHT